MAQDRFTGYEHQQLAALRRAVEGGNIKELEKEINKQIAGKTRKRSDIVKLATRIACEDGFADALVYLLKDEHDASNIRVGEGGTLLHFAVSAASEALNNGRKDDTMQHRLPNGVNSVALKSDTYRSLKISGRLVNGSDRFKIVRILLTSGVDVKVFAKDGKTALMLARHIDIVKLMLDESPEAEIDELLKHRDHEGNDALLLSIIEDHDCEIAHCLIGHKADLATKDRRDRTALMAAAWKNKLAVVDKLRRHDGVAKMIDRDGRTIWHHVAQDRDPLWKDDLIEQFLSNGSVQAELEIPDANGKTCLHWIATIGNELLAERLLGQGLFSTHTIKKAEPQHEKTALHFAAAYDNTKLVELLLTHGAQANARSDSGWTALHMACGNGLDSIEIVKLLFANPANRADVNAKTANGQTALHLASAYGQLKIVEYLLDHNASVDAKELGGFTAMHVACGSRAPWFKLPQVSDDQEKVDGAIISSEPLRVIEALRGRGAKLNVQSDAGKTPLHVAAESGDKALVEFLLEQDGIQWSTRDNSGTSPLVGASIAKSRTSKENIADVEAVIKLLAPWEQQQTKALPGNVRQAVRGFEATIVRFDQRERLYRVPVYDLLYKPPGAQGSISKTAVSTRCCAPAKIDEQSGKTAAADEFLKDKSKPSSGTYTKERLRWIHLPANNTAWCRTLLTKRFIEDGCNDIRGFKDMERALNNQYHGPTPHSHYIRAGAQSLTHPDPTEFRTFIAASRSNSLEHDFRTPERVSQPDLVRRLSDMPKHSFEDEGWHRRPPLSQQSRSAPSINPAQLMHADTDMTTSSPVELETEIKRGKIPLGVGNMFISIPYLDFESVSAQKAMREAVDDTLANRSSPYDGSKRRAGIKISRDEVLIRAYSPALSKSLHIRRTLDQFYYRSIDTRDRDGDQVVSRYLEASPDPKMLMVDQLWLWVVGDLVVTSFPQPWRQPESEFSGVLGNILEDINSPTGPKIEHAYDLVDCVIRHVLVACDHYSLRNGIENFSDMFESAIGKALDTEVALYDRFQGASIASFVEPVQHATDKAKGVQGARADDELTFDGSHLDISGETKLLREVKDISDELGILQKLFEVQARVLQEMSETFASMEQMLNTRKDFKKARLSILEQASSRDHAINQIEGMTKQTHHIYENTKDLLNLEQTRAQSIEAWFARSRAESTARQGQTVMVFTIVTVVFLPLSFIAAFFAIEISELPHVAEQQEMSLSYVSKYIFGIGVPFAVICIIVGFYGDVRRAYHFLRGVYTYVLNKIRGPGTLPKWKVK